MKTYTIGAEELKEHLTDETVSVGSILVGARITAGRTLEDVNADLRIPVAILTSFEADDLSEIATKPYLTGYIRSYARYLGVDPEALMDIYRDRQLLPMAQGLNPSVSKTQVGLLGGAKSTKTTGSKTQFNGSGYYPNRNNRGFGIEAGVAALGLFVPVALVGAVIFVGGYGAFTVLGGFQGLDVVPAEVEPQVQIDVAAVDQPDIAPEDGAFAIPAIDYDQLYERQALQSPVVKPRVNRIVDLIERKSSGTVLPNAVAPEAIGEADAIELASATDQNPVIDSPIVSVGPSKPSVQLLPLDEAWVSISDEDGNVINETLLKPGQGLDIPFDGIIPVLRRAGNANLLYVRVNGTVFGPIGLNGETVVNNVALTPQALDTVYDPVGEDILTPLSEVENAYLAKLTPADANN